MQNDGGASVQTTAQQGAAPPAQRAPGLQLRSFLTSLPAAGELGRSVTAGISLCLAAGGARTLVTGFPIEEVFSRVPAARFHERAELRAPAIARRLRFGVLRFEVL